MLKDQTMQPTLLQEDFHANLSALQEKEREQMMIATSGMKLLESLPSVSRAGLLGKMLKDLLTSTTAWSSDRCKLIWKIKVSKSNVLLFQLQASVHGIKGKESGLLDSMLPTPTTMDHIDRKGMRPSRAATNRKTGYLSEMIKMYPTPTASCQMDVVAPPETVLQNSKGWTVTRKKTGTKFGAKLNDVVNKIEKMYPTPTARDHKDMGYQPTWKPSRDKSVPRIVLKNNKPGGKLNPNFVEFLMGYPQHWTKIDPTE
jgi:hypothetical protein